jgi:hypothetical protein
VRAGVSVPPAKVNSKTDAFDPPPTYTRSPRGAKAMPSQASATGTLALTSPDAASITVMEGGR